MRRIIALDLGKFKPVACVMDASDRSHAFETIGMSPALVNELLARRAPEDPADTLVVCETCDCCQPARPAGGRADGRVDGRARQVVWA
jgi:hypothetical protein